MSLEAWHRVVCPPRYDRHQWLPLYRPRLAVARSHLLYSYACGIYIIGAVFVGHDGVVNHRCVGGYRNLCVGGQNRQRTDCYEE